MTRKYFIYTRLFVIDKYEGFSKVSDLQCKSIGPLLGRKQLGNIGNKLEGSIKECRKDDKCHGVVNWKCDGKPVFKHCLSQDAMEPSPKWNSCIYKKKSILLMILPDNFQIQINVYLLLMILPYLDL